MSGPNGDPDISIDDGIIEDGDEFTDEEFVAINSMLDQINSYLDDLEEKNDALNGKMHKLLESNRQARLEFRAQMLAKEEEDHRSGDSGESSPGTEDQHKETS
ncbi:UPF0184 protein C9orf16 homolog [Dunckerocampus dactyliophorus]|uniref:UPF0184 protein C9orf16 homolog n=1 Tax=Dunckerocampus dactyliophorus TaxID=161453 RepID=UPI002405908F|nr:UPF0184 protein C9orf16 homolog [Dunckerocampus dactyliophorus]